MAEDIRDERKEPHRDTGAGQNPARCDSDRDYAARNHSEEEQSTSRPEAGALTSSAPQEGALNSGPRTGGDGWRAVADSEIEQPGNGDPLGDGVR